MRKISGKKKLMTRVFDEDGHEIAVTLVEFAAKENIENFKEKEKLVVTGISKGKGFAGTVKRHHFHTGPRTHGSNNYRQPGSIGDTGPQRVVKGRRMAGHLGAKKTTVRNLEIYKIEAAKKLVFIKGGIPGPRNAKVLIWSRNEA